MIPGAMTMRRLNARLIAALDVPDRDEELITAVGRAIAKVRGRPVRLRAVAFPPGTASGVWIDCTKFDLLAYEKHTDPGHQLVIIGHELWHMFQGHRSSLTEHGAIATRARNPDAAETLQDLVTVLSGAEAAGLPAVEHGDLGFHVAMRADASEAHQEGEAEIFGVRFATTVHTALMEARSSAAPENLAGRIQVSMAHRIRGS